MLRQREKQRFWRIKFDTPTESIQIMKPEDLTIEDLEMALSSPADQWHGKCTAVSYAAQKLIGGHNIYGDYLGYVDANGYWGHRRQYPNHHGWVLLDDGRVIDPTRWSFENVEPYIYIGHNETDYDEGSNKMREQLRGECPGPNGKKANLKFDTGADALFEHLTETPADEITVSQAMWVANESYDQLGFAVYGIYKTLIDSDMGAFIPIDNVNRAKREGRLDA